MSHVNIPDLDDDRVLRNVELDGYRLMTWDTNRRMGNKDRLGYALWAPGRWDDEPLFAGEDFGSSPMHAIDSDDTLRAILGFLTLRPGDTDADYFDDYTEEQMDFARGDAESLSLWSLEPERGEEEMPFRDLDTGALDGLSAGPRGTVDEAAATELQLFIDNDGDLYRAQTQSIHANAAKKVASGKYDPVLAIKLWRYLVDAGAKKYAKEFASPGDWSTMFNVPTRDLVASRMSTEWFEEHQVQRGRGGTHGLGDTSLHDSDGFGAGLGMWNPRR